MRELIISPSDWPDHQLAIKRTSVGIEMFSLKDSKPDMDFHLNLSLSEAALIADAIQLLLESP